MFRNMVTPRVSQALALPAPTGGINDLDPISSMEPNFALQCTNFFPDTGLLVVRPGYQEWATGLANPVQTIMYYNAMDGSFERFASTVAGIFDVTAAGAGPTNVKAATNGDWEFVNFATSAGQYLVAANGVDPAVLYDGATWIDFTEVVTPAGPGQIKGVDPTDLNFVIAHKGRLWFIEKSSMTAWYLPIDSVGGEAKPFYLGGIFRRGGYLRIMARWSSDTGEGLDDRLIFITSQGEIASYAGNDPADANDWSLDSIFYVAAPLSDRSVTEYGGDLLMLCRRGLIPLSSLISGRSNEVLFSDALTKRISRTLMQLTANASPPFQPEVTLYNDLAWVVINIYDSADASVASYNRLLSSGTNQPVQLVMNFLTGAWGKFDYPVRTVRAIDQLLFMGTEDGRVIVVTPSSYMDNVQLDGEDGVPIEATVMSAYTYLNDPTANKHAKLVRPVFQSEIKPSFVMRVLPDFRLDPFLSTPPPNPAQGNAKWDISRWDLANWAGLENVYRPWVSSNQLGYAFAFQLKVSTSSPLGLASNEWVWENGGLV